MRRGVQGAKLALVVAASLCCAGRAGFGQGADTPPQARSSASPGEVQPGGAASEKARREESLRDLQRRVQESEETRRRLASEADALRADAAALGAKLVEAGARVQATEARLGAVEARLETLGDSESAIRLSLESRRAVIAEVLAALQRIGRRAPPPLLVRPEDILAALRSSMLLGAVVPGLRDEVQSIAGDLAELVRLRDLAASDRDILARELEILADDRERLAGLTQLRREQLVAAASQIGTAKARSEALGAQARSVRDLIDRLDAEIGAARRQTEEDIRRAEAEARAVRERFAAAATRDPVRLAPKVPFAEAKGSIGRPLVGSVAKDFGSPDGQGGSMRGVVISARPKAVVTSPCEGWISYAGPFRSFGRLLIINAGGGYYVLLAGMDQISVEAGQFVLAGEPVGQMGETASSSAALGAVEGSGPALYVEFRKDGGPIDPRPWWAKSQGERVRG